MCVVKKIVNVYNMFVQCSHYEAENPSMFNLYIYLWKKNEVIKACFKLCMLCLEKNYFTEK